MKKWAIPGVIVVVLIAMLAGGTFFIVKEGEYRAVMQFGEAKIDRFQCWIAYENSVYSNDEIFA